MNTITLKFADTEDLKAFERYVEKARATEGTVGGLYSGLMCSAVKRSKTKQDHSPDLVEACRTAIKMLGYLGQTKLVGYSQIQEAINKTEGNS